METLNTEDVETTEKPTERGTETEMKEKRKETETGTRIEMKGEMTGKKGIVVKR